MLEHHGRVDREGDLVAECVFCSWTATHPRIVSPPETIIRDTIDAIAFLRARLIEHVDREHPEMIARRMGRPH